MHPEGLKKLKIILGSASPRRKQLLENMNLNFEVIQKEVDESFPESLKGKEAAEYLAEKKAKAYSEKEISNKVLITADTIVILNDKIIGKPGDTAEAIKFLRELSGNKHEVITAVCIYGKNFKKTFSVSSNVYFRKLSDEEINFYVKNYKPFDKAGAYGVQDWIGLTAIEKIEGSFFNVMGLPTSELYLHLKELS